MTARVAAKNTSKTSVKGNPFIGQNRTKKHRAAILLAEDELSDDAIAETVGIVRSTLSEWKLDPEFAAVVGGYQGSIVAEALKLPIAKKHERIRQLNNLNETYWQIINDRASTYGAMADTPEEAARSVFGSDTVPWARTGMMVRQPKISASGKTVVEWGFDKSLDSAIKETLKQAAAELGQADQTLNVNHTGELSVDLMRTAQELAAKYGTTPEEVLALASEDNDE